MLKSIKNALGLVPDWLLVWLQSLAWFVGGFMLCFEIVTDPVLLAELSSDPQSVLLGVFLGMALVSAVFYIPWFGSEKPQKPTSSKDTSIKS